MAQVSDRQRLIVLLNEAKLQSDKERRLTVLSQIEEILVNAKESQNLLSGFLGSVLEFHLDNTPQVRKFLAGFIEKACKTDPSCVPQCVETLLYLANDVNPNVLKRVIQVATYCYRKALQFLAKQHNVTQAHSKLWSVMTQLKRKMVDFMESPNDGISTQAIHFVENLAILFSSAPATPLIVAHRKGKVKLTVEVPPEESFSLNNVAPNHSLLNIATLKQEGEQYIALLLVRLARPDVPYTNVSVLIQALFNIIKQRQQWWTKLLPVVGKFHAALPTNLTESQISSIRVSLRTMMLFFLRMPSMKQYRVQITKTLGQLDCKAEAISAAAKLADKAAEIKPESVLAQTVQVKTEKEKTKRPLESYEEEPEKKVRKLTHESSSSEAQPPAAPAPADVTVKTIDTPFGRFSAKELADLVVNNFVNSDIPRSNAQVPSLSSTNFNPFPAIIQAAISNIGPNEKMYIQHLIQPAPTAMAPTPAPGAFRGPPGFRPMPAPVIPLPKAPENLSSLQSRIAPPPEEMDQADDSFLAEPLIELEPVKEEKKEEPEEEAPPIQQISNLADQLAAKVQLLGEEEKKLMIDMNYQRLLSSERELDREGNPSFRMKLLVKMVSKKEESSEWFMKLFEHIKEDVKRRFDLALQWLYEEYIQEAMSQFKSKKQRPTQNGDSGAQSSTRYERLFDSLLMILREELQPNDLMFTRFLTEAPKITDFSLNMVREYVEDKDRVTLGLITLRDLILKREPVRFKCLNYLLEYSVHTNENIRSQAIRLTRNQLYPLPIFTHTIQSFAASALEKLLNPTPPEISQTEGAVQPAEETPAAPTTEAAAPAESTAVTTTQPESTSKWTTDLVKRYASLLTSLCVTNEALIDNLINVFTNMKYCKVEEEPKKTILAEAESLIRTLGPSSSYVLHFLRTFPDEAEDIALGFVQNLIESSKGQPPVELVLAIKDVFFKRNKRNAKFLLPVLFALSREEIIAGLEQLVQLPDALVDIAIQKIMSLKSSNISIAPSEFMQALHVLDAKNPTALRKRVIYAINYCFRFKSVFTRGVLAIVLQHLVELDPIPPLFMRTVLQSITVSPDIAGFMPRILERLIAKKVWEVPLLWEGFVKYIKKKNLWPGTFEVVCQLPLKELKKLIEQNLELRDPLLKYVSSMKNPSHSLLSTIESVPPENGAASKH